MKNRFKKLLSETVTTKIFTGRKLDLCFNKKDETNLEHKHDITYHGKCSENDCPNNYLRQKEDYLRQLKTIDEQTHYIYCNLKQNLLKEI